MQFLKLACVCMLAWCMVASMAHAQVQPVDSGGGPAALPHDNDHLVMPEIAQKARANAQRLGLYDYKSGSMAASAKGVISSVDRSTVGRFIFPLRMSAASENVHNHGISNFVDLNDTYNQLQDYECGQRTYDLSSGYDHQGTDLFTYPFPWERMDNDETLVVAAADGTIVVKQDGEYDRQCGSAPSSAQPNYIAVQHADGLISYYLHFKKNSLTSKGVGDTVKSGEFLGQVGSSGFSSGPHLHFEIQDASGNIVDPYAGSCGATDTLWKSQEPYRNPRIMRVGTHNSAPVPSSDGCANGTPNYSREFTAGQVISVAAYLRDQPSYVRARMSLIKPDGTEYAWGYGGSPTGGEYYTIAWWYLNWVLGSDVGEWKARVEFNGMVHEESFWVGEAKPANTALVSSVLPGSRSVQAGDPATFFLTALNYGSTDASGCYVTTDVPVAGDFHFQTTDPATNALTGEIDQAVAIAAGTSQSFLLSVETDGSSEASSQEVPVRVKCSNSDAVATISGVNSFILSFGSAAVADVIGVSLTPSNDGTLSIPGSGGANAFVVATSNVGVADTLTISPRSDVPGLVMAICETNPSIGTCLASPSSSVDMTFGANSTNSFAVFVTATQAVPFDPGNSRIVVDITDAGGTLRGSTSVAVRTDG